MGSAVFYSMPAVTYEVTDTFNLDDLLEFDRCDPLPYHITAGPLSTVS